MRESIKVLVFFTILTGLIYPTLVTGVSQILFPYKANGSLIKNMNEIVGSELISQKTSTDKYFWPRPSASDYGALPSSATNLGPISKKLSEHILERKKSSATDEMLTASASGLDPHLTLASIEEQKRRVITARNFSPEKKEKLEQIITELTEGRTFYILGSERINVLKLNLALDQIQ